MGDICEQGARIEEEVERIRDDQEEIFDRLEALKIELLERIAALFQNGPVTRLEARIAKLEGTLGKMAQWPGGGFTWHWLALILWAAFTAGVIAGAILGHEALGLHLPL